MAPSNPIPRQIAGYDILPISLPPLQSFPTAATHYLYLAPHQPKLPSPTASRSLFLVNVPFDATVGHIKHLLSVQVGLPVGRIEDIQFEGQRRQGTFANAKESSNEKPIKRGKKRKRGGETGNIENIEGAALPSTWDRELQINGLTAVVLFVDRASSDAALKAVRVAHKKGEYPVWGDGMEDMVPALGSASESSSASGHDKVNLYFQRIPKPS